MELRLEIWRTEPDTHPEISTCLGRLSIELPADHTAVTERATLDGASPSMQRALRAFVQTLEEDL